MNPSEELGTLGTILVPKHRGQEKRGGQTSTDSLQTSTDSLLTSSDSLPVCDGTQNFNDRYTLEYAHFTYFNPI